MITALDLTFVAWSEPRIWSPRCLFSCFLFTPTCQIFPKATLVGVGFIASLWWSSWAGRNSPGGIGSHLFLACHRRPLLHSTSVPMMEKKLTGFIASFRTSRGMEPSSTPHAWLLWWPLYCYCKEGEPQHHWQILTIKKLPSSRN